MRLFKDRLFRSFCTVLTWATVVFLLLLLFHIFSKGLKFLNLNFLTSFPSRFPEASGIFSSIVGSCLLILVTACFAIPFGVLTGIFIQEYFEKKNKRHFWFSVNIYSLSGMPSIIYGLVGLALFSNFFNLGNSLLAGGLTLGFLILPVIVITTQEALKGVPKSVRYAAYALGARRYQVVFGQVVPAALSHIMTGFIFSLSRAIGETAPLIVIGGLTYAAFLPSNLIDSFTALPLQIYNWAGRPQADFHQLASSAIIVLLCILFILNSLAIYIRQKYGKYKL